jgi:hypothetical protein
VSQLGPVKHRHLDGDPVVLIAKWKCCSAALGVPGGSIGRRWNLVLRGIDKLQGDARWVKLALISSTHPHGGGVLGGSGSGDSAMRVPQRKNAIHSECDIT